MFVYMLLCADGTIYTGTARDLAHRMRDHFECTPACAAYTRAHKAIYLLGAWECDSRSGALRAEAAIRRLPRREKEALLAAPEGLSAERFPSLTEEYRPLPEGDERLRAVRTAYPIGE